MISILTKECKHVFEGLKSMEDVAGGTGATAKGIADAFPGLKCIVLELSHVVACLEGFENLTYAGGDMFNSIPRADAVFLKVYVELSSYFSYHDINFYFVVLMILISHCTRSMIRTRIFCNLSLITISDTYTIRTTAVG